LEAAARVAAGRPPRRRDAWLNPLREVFRRLIYKQGLLDGPAGWAFSVLSGLAEWVLAREHRRLWVVARNHAVDCNHKAASFPSVQAHPIATSLRGLPPAATTHHSPLTTHHSPLTANHSPLHIT